MMFDFLFYFFDKLDNILTKQRPSSKVYRLYAKGNKKKRKNQNLPPKAYGKEY